MNSLGQRKIEVGFLEAPGSPLGPSGLRVRVSPSEAGLFTWQHLACFSFGSLLLSAGPETSLR